MKTSLFIALILGCVLVSCSKEKTGIKTEDSTVSNTLSADTSMALPPSDTAAMNASSPGRTDSANTKRDSVTSPTRR
ncbi:MAG: hypothetical protein J6O88_00735 [Chryseobacterium sp.]|uniref:hypothetical protein n=1 Tax=Chryseobacterium sp. TaxID=1871047 RepID=UPI001B1DD9E4|nr:hypothetical protein [Chryseobacterium sp.]MBO6183202.1 hypothetical protein [Chryseobacterium sp.]